MKTLQRFLAWRRERAFWRRETRLMMTWWEREAEHRFGLYLVIVGTVLALGGFYGASALREHSASMFAVIVAAVVAGLGFATMVRGFSRIIADW